MKEGYGYCHHCEEVVKRKGHDCDSVDFFSLFIARLAEAVYSPDLDATDRRLN